MRVVASCIAIVMCAACGQPGPPAAPSSSVVPTTFNAARIDRVRSRLPAGYEFGRLSDRTAPADFWGFGQGWTADPPPCAGLANPAGDAVTRGWSASGSGGIVYAVVADASVELDSTLRDACATWTLTAGPTTGAIALEGPPTIDGATTLGMAADVTTTVEGGTETHSHADTFVAYLGDHVAYVTVVTDPGASGAALGPGVASDLLVETVAAIRG
jgi:uncharacterized protein DUF5642